MCGISGYLNAAGAPTTYNPEALLSRMGQAIAHRGPDDTGVWYEADVGLVQRRLSIIDLSAAGHQPMHSASGRYVIVFNGEIYNYMELRRELEQRSVASPGAATPTPKRCWPASRHGASNRRYPTLHRHVRVRPVGSTRAHV